MIFEYGQKICGGFLVVAMLVVSIIVPLACRKTDNTALPYKKSAAESRPFRAVNRKQSPAPSPKFTFNRGASEKTVLAIVPLCDNVNQGIVKVPSAIGNGQDSAGNLYWGAMYGLKTFFSKSPNWKKISASPPIKDDTILEWAAFSHADASRSVTLYAAAVDGAKMKRALELFFLAAAQGGFDVVCFVGHNGLMDVPLSQLQMPSPANPSSRAVVLACKSDVYFTPPLEKLGVRPLIMTSQFMAPEAYTLDAILCAWAKGQPSSAIADVAGKAYSNYQKCSPAAARKIFVAGRD